MTQSTIIILNGTSSSGKTSLCRAIQKLADTKYMHINVDVVAEMLPAGFFGEGAERKPKVRQFIKGVHKMVGGFAEMGHHVLLDQITVRHDMMTDCLASYGGYKVYFVGMICSLEELERREIARGNRKIGLAQMQFGGIHLHKIYDLELDVEQFSLEECAVQLLAHVNNHPPVALDKMRERLSKGEWVGKHKDE